MQNILSIDVHDNNLIHHISSRSISNGMDLYDARYKMYIVKQIEGESLDSRGLRRYVVDDDSYSVGVDPSNFFGRKSSTKSDHNGADFIKREDFDPQGKSCNYKYMKEFVLSYVMSFSSDDMHYGISPQPNRHLITERVIVSESNMNYHTSVGGGGVKYKGKYYKRIRLYDGKDSPILFIYLGNNKPYRSHWRKWKPNLESKLKIPGTEQRANLLTNRAKKTDSQALHSKTNAYQPTLYDTLNYIPTYNVYHLYRLPHTILKRLIISMLLGASIYLISSDTSALHDIIHTLVDLLSPLSYKNKMVFTLIPLQYIDTLLCGIPMIAGMTPSTYNSLASRYSTKMPHHIHIDIDSRKIVFDSILLSEIDVPWVVIHLIDHMQFQSTNTNVMLLSRMQLDSLYEERFDVWVEITKKHHVNFRYHMIVCAAYLTRYCESCVIECHVFSRCKENCGIDEFFDIDEFVRLSSTGETRSDKKNGVDSSYIYSAKEKGDKNQTEKVKSREETESTNKKNHYREFYKQMVNTQHFVDYIYHLTHSRSNGAKQGPHSQASDLLLDIQSSGLISSFDLRDISHNITTYMQNITNVVSYKDTLLRSSYIVYRCILLAKKQTHPPEFLPTHKKTDSGLSSRSQSYTTNTDRIIHLYNPYIIYG